MAQNIPSDDAREKFLCNDHPRPLVLRTIIETLMEDSHHPSIRSYRDLADCLGIDQETLPITALEALHLVDRRNDGLFLTVDNYPVEIAALDDRFRFQVFLLNRIASLSWSDSRLAKQAHFLLVYESLLRAERAALDFKQVKDLNDLNLYLEQRGYEAYAIMRGARHRMRFNENKLHFWCILADYLGLTHPGPEGRKSAHLVYLSEDILLAFLHLHIERERSQSVPGVAGRIGFLDEFLKWSMREFLMIPPTASQDLPRAVMSAFMRLEKSGRIMLSVTGDAPGWMFPDDMSSTDLRRKVSAFEV